MKTCWMLFVLEIIVLCSGVHCDSKNETNKIFQIGKIKTKISHDNLTMKIAENMKKIEAENSTKLFSGQLINENLSIEFKEPFVFSLMDNSTRFQADEVRGKLKNVVYVMVENNEENFWRVFKDKYPSFVQGFLQECRTNDSLTPEKCGCEKNLDSNVSALLNWARLHEKMNTATIFTGNMTSSSFVENVDVFRKFDIDDELIDNQKILNPWSETPAINNQSTPPTASSFPSLFQNEDKKDETWDLMNIFSQIRLAWFKGLLDSLQDDFNRTKNSRIRRDVFNDPPEITGLFEKTIKDFQIIPNDNGYILIAAIPGTELLNITEIVIREISSTDTLVVITGMCSKHGKLIPVFLSGPKSKQILNDTQTIDELSSVIKLNLEKCHEHCKNKSLIVSTFDIPKKRVARSDDEEEENLSEEEKHHDDLNPAASTTSDMEQTESSAELTDEEILRSLSASGGFSHQKSLMEIVLGLVVTIAMLFILHT